MTVSLLILTSIDLNYFSLLPLKFMTNDNLNKGNAEIERDICNFGNSNIV
jgi:hypothetical protein